MPDGDVEILSVKTVVSPIPGESDPDATYISDATVVSAVVFRSAEQAKAYAQASAQDLETVLQT